MAGVFAREICFIDLSGVTYERSVDDAIAATLRLPTNTGHSSTGAILDYLCDKTMPMVLDNCEHLVKACAHLVQCRDIYQSLGYQRGVATAIHNLGETAQKMGDYASARKLLCESLRIRHHLGLQRGYPYSFELLAQVNESEEHYERAVQLLAAAETLRIRIGAPLEQVALKHVKTVLARARARLGNVVFELAWSKGAAMTTEQTIALALS